MVLMELSKILSWLVRKLDFERLGTWNTVIRWVIMPKDFRNSPVPAGGTKEEKGIVPGFVRTNGVNECF